MLGISSQGNTRWRLRQKGTTWAVTTNDNTWTVMPYCERGHHQLLRHQLRPKSKRQNILICVYVHCKENPIYVFSEKELPGLHPIFYIHVYVSDLYIPRIGPHILLQQNRQTDHGNI
jgi:hypothetical protein